MNLKIFAELNKDTLNEPQRKLIEAIENLYSILELDDNYVLKVDELTNEHIYGVMGTSKGPLNIKLINDGVLYYRYSGYSSKMNPPANLNDTESLERFKKYVREF